MPKLHGDRLALRLQLQRACPREGVKKLLKQYIDLHNQIVTHGSATDGDDILADDVEIDVEGSNLSRLRCQAMIRSFQEHEVVLWKIGAVGEDVAFASYAWRDHPRIGGLIRLQRRGDRVARVTLRPGYSRIFGLLAKQGEPLAFCERGGEDAFAPSGPPS